MWLPEAGDEGRKNRMSKSGQKVQASSWKSK